MRRGAQARLRGANDANRDSAVARDVRQSVARAVRQSVARDVPQSFPCDVRQSFPRLALPALLLAGLFTACAPRPPADVTVAVREAGGENEPDADPDTPEMPAPPAPVAASVADSQVVWLTSEEEALERGLAERRPVLVHFETDWCADCRRMVSETFGDPRVKTQAGRFVAVRIDATNDEDPQVSAALSKYAVVSVPTLILLDSSGHERRRFTELVGPDTLLAEIDRVR